MKFIGVNFMGKRRTKIETWCERERKNCWGLSLSILWKVYELQLVAFILFALKELILKTWKFWSTITWGIYILTINYFWHQWITLASRLSKAPGLPQYFFNWLIKILNYQKANHKKKTVASVFLPNCST